MPTEIIGALIETCGVVSAALIAAFGAKKIVKDSINTRFSSYADQSHDVTDLFVRSQNDVFIVAAVGDVFLKKYLGRIKKLLNRGIHIKYLLLTESLLQTLENYICEKDVDISFREGVIDNLKALKEEYKDLFEVREFDSQMTASYICIDILSDPSSFHFLSSSVIQIMLYQYGVRAEKSPITYISPKNDEKEFRTTVNSIMKMWRDAQPLFESAHNKLGEGDTKTTG